jgi:hypothetical protein
MSIVFDHVGVLIGGLASKTTVAVFWITVPVVRLEPSVAVNKTLPSAPGGRKPTVGSVGGWFVDGSRDSNVQVRTPVFMFKDA